MACGRSAHPRTTGGFRAFEPRREFVQEVRQVIPQRRPGKPHAPLIGGDCTLPYADDLVAVMSKECVRHQGPSVGVEPGRLQEFLVR